MNTKKEDIIEAIRRCASNGEKASIEYRCWTEWNNEYIDVKVCGILFDQYKGDEPRGFKENLEFIVNELKSEFPDLHINEKRIELHFHYSGFNSVGSATLPFEISNESIKNEVKKAGIKKESHRMVGDSKVSEIIEKYPDYEVYVRYGFGFRGASDNRIDHNEGWRERLMGILKGRACSDIDVIDNEIHINSFSYNDME